MKKILSLLLTLAFAFGCAKSSDSTGTQPSAPTLSYGATNFLLTGIAITAITPTLTGTVTSCSASPALPAGLAIGATTCVISGTPTAAQAQTTHTVTASNANASGTATVSITVSSTTATRVYGQAGSFTTNPVNNGGLSANSLNVPMSVAVDATGVYVVDNSNHRVLFYSGTSTTASRVYGQGGSFTTNTANSGGLSANSLNFPSAVAVDGTGVYIADTGNHRVLFYSGTSTTATRVYGQGGSFTTNTTNSGGLSANSLNQPYSVAVDSTGVYVADFANHRVLFYVGTSTTATRVYGQGGSFTANTQNNGGLSANSLFNPFSVAVDATGLYVVDHSNQRVLFYAGASTTATRVYGQGGSFTANTANNGGLSANSLNFPRGVTVLAAGVLVSDSTNNRLLFFAGTSTTATGVYGQGGSFTANTANNGGLSANSLNSLAGPVVDATGVYVADRVNHRVLFY